MRQTIDNSGENNSFLNFYFNVKKGMQEKKLNLQLSSIFL